MKRARTARNCGVGPRTLRLEAMEPRQMLDGQGFLQGFAFVDLNDNNQLDASDERKVGATINLYMDSDDVPGFSPAELSAPVATTLTDADGYYIFEGLSAGTYRIEEVAPAGYVTFGTQILSQLNPATAVGNQIEVKLIDPASVVVNYNYADFLALGRFEDLTLDFFVGNGGFTASTGAGLLPVTITRPAPDGTTATIYTVCANPFQDLVSGTNIFSAVPDALPSGPGMPHNWERISYLFNHYMTNEYGEPQPLSSIDAAAMQIAVWELLYDPGTDPDVDPDPFDDGNIKNITNYTGSGATSPAEAAAVVAKATFYVHDSFGKNEASTYLNAVASISGGLQSMICTGMYNFANRPEPGIKLEKFTNGFDVSSMDDAPEIAPGATITWTYKVTNTGGVPFTFDQIVVVDDNGTPGNPADDFYPTLDVLSDAGGDLILSPGETWTYEASGVALDLIGGPVGPAVTFNMSGNSALDGTDGNVRTFTAGGISVNVSAFSRELGTNGAWTPAWLGAYSGGLGVTDSSEGSGGSNMHTVDNVGRDNYVLFEFSETVVVDSAFLGYVVDDSDLTIWIGTLTDPFNNHATLSDVVLAGLGFTEVNLGGPAARLADFNAGNVAGNVVVIAARPGESSPNDRFKIEKMTVQKVEKVCYENYAYVSTGPGGPTDSDNSGYCNPHDVTPGIDIEKTTNGPSNANPTAPDYDNEDAPNGAGVPILTPGSSVTWTYKVTNTGNVPFAFNEVVITDDNGTPGNAADDLSTTGGQIMFHSVLAGDADNILEPGEVWIYQAAGTVKNLAGPVGPATTFNFSGSSSVSGTAGNVRTFTADSISVKASAFSRDKSSGAWSTAYLGSYSGGLGVTDGSESGSSDTHTVDNIGRDNYVLLRFSETIIVDSAYLGYVVGDSDLKIWIGTISNAYSGTVALSDSVLAGLGFSEVNLGGGSARTADVNAGNVAGNVIVIAADPGSATSDDRFKIKLLTVNKPGSGIYENKAKVVVPGDSDADLSHYKNPVIAPPPTGSIAGKKYRDQTGNGLTADDTPLANTVIYLDLNNNGSKDANEPATTTAADGSYKFTGLAAGLYYVREVVPNGFIRTAPTLADHYSVNLASGAAVAGKDFANFEKPCTACTLTNVTYTIKRGSSTFTVTDLRGKTDQGDIVTVNFTVTAGAGMPQLSLVSYTAPDPYFDANRASLQKIYEGQTGFFLPGTHSMTVTIPKSYFQIDFVCGAIIDKLGPAGSNVFYTPQGRLISADNDGLTAPSSSLQPLGTTLIVGGGSGNDVIQFKTATDASKIAVMINGSTAGQVSFGSGSGVSIARLAANGYAGNDMILVTGLSLPATLRGGDGHDVLVGGAGNDTLDGGAGRDLMIGGAGKDILRGSAQDDILIGGTTAWDANLVALDKIMQEWTRSDTFANRVNRLKSTASDGLNGAYNLVADGTSKTVFDDDVQDSLYGDDGSDWILGNNDADGGSVNDLVFSGESFTDID